jgi:cytochrome b
MRSATASSQYVWDIVQRVLHWGLVSSIATAWWAGEGRLAIHLAAGYAALAIVACRAVWGWVGSPHARFADFMQSPKAVWRYARAVAAFEEPRWVGHNPLGGWMVAALLVLIAGVCVSGWLYTTDHFWGMAWLESLHVVGAWVSLGFVALHVAGVLFTSWRHRENLVAAMWTGRKRR